MQKWLILLYLTATLFCTVCVADISTDKETSFALSSAYLTQQMVQQKTMVEPQVRPFITDDSRVVGNKLTQLESWTRFDKHAAEHWILGAYGPTNWLELTVGGVWGSEFDSEGNTLSYGLPLLQAKFLLRPYESGSWPGLGAVVGTFLPYGKGGLRADGYGTFGFLTVSQCFGPQEDVLIHANVGANYLRVNGENELLNTWGLGSQIRTLKGFHLVGEVFSGDPYIPGSGISWQAGFRHFFSDELQIDGTVGKGISGEVTLPLWVSVGIRLVFNHFRDKKLAKDSTSR